MKPISRRTFVRATAGLVAFIPAAQGLAQVPVAKACRPLPPDCDCNCFKGLSYTGADCHTYCAGSDPGTCYAPQWVIYGDLLGSDGQTVKSLVA